MTNHLHPVYEAIRHHCLAGEFLVAWNLYWERISQKIEKVPQHIAFNNFGAIAEGLNCLRYFFVEGDWDKVAVPVLCQNHCDHVLYSEVGAHLRAEGKLELAAIMYQRAEEAAAKASSSNEGLEATEVSASSYSECMLLLGEPIEARKAVTRGEGYLKAREPNQMDFRWHACQVALADADMTFSGSRPIADNEAALRDAFKWWKKECLEKYRSNRKVHIARVRPIYYLGTLAAKRDWAQLNDEVRDIRSAIGDPPPDDLSLIFVALFKTFESEADRLDPNLGAERATAAANRLREAIGIFRKARNIYHAPRAMIALARLHIEAKGRFKIGGCDPDPLPDLQFAQEFCRHYNLRPYRLRCLYLMQDSCHGANLFQDIDDLEGMFRLGEDCPW